jgi:signal transduction histidine kinase/ActR/RegA family two-component response regulator/HAMP domain-containing protein
VPPHADPNNYRFEDGCLVLFRHIELNGESIGTVYLKSDLGELHARLWHYTLIMLLFTLAALAATCLLAARLQRIISRPIFHLAQTAKTVSEGKNYSVRATRESNDELGQLIDGFNGMLAQIQERDGALRRVNDELENRVAERTRDLQQHLDHISLLNQITYAVAERRDSADTIPIVLQQLDNHLPLDYSVAYRLDEPAGMWTFIGRGLKSKSLAEQIQAPVSIPVANTMFSPCSKGEIVYVPDQSAFDPVPGQADLPVLRNVAGAGLISAVGAPLIVEGKVFGVLVFRRRARDGFSEAERDFIKGLSAHVSQAIYQAQLYQNLQKAYDELRQTQQAAMQQERLKALGQMASGVAHDINNALSPIVISADLIQCGESHLTAEDKTHLEYIRTAGKDIAQIVARLREFYRPRAGKESLQPLDLNLLVEQAVGMTRPRWRDISQSRGLMIEMCTDLEPHLPKVAGNESEIREMLTNLIFNAVDALPDGGVITIRSRATAQAPAAAPGKTTPQVILEVADTGVGMDETTRQHCLEPFFSTKGQRGTGLGLAMVYGVVERHDGKIEIDSLPGKGTTMRLIFPVRKIKPSGAAASPQDAKVRPLRILCIDDEPLVRVLIQKILRRDGHQAEVADGGQAGIEAFRAARHRNEPFDVIFTDLGMPYVDGREVAAAVKRESPGTPVVMLTGWGAFMKADGSAPAEIDGLLSKPPSIKEIREMLQRVVSRPA